LEEKFVYESEEVLRVELMGRRGYSRPSLHLLGRIKRAG